MSAEYNSKLIAELYQQDNVESAIVISDEMTVINDPVFIYPTYEMYKKFTETTSAHYFVANLALYKTPEVTDILKEIASGNASEADLAMMLDHFIKIEYFDHALVNKVKTLVIKKLASGRIDTYDDTFFKYLEKANELSPLVDIMQSFFEDEDFTKEARKVVLPFILRVEPKKYLQYYIDNYRKIKNTKAEVIFAEEIVGWKGPLTQKVKELILKDGTSWPKEIIQAEIDAKKKKDEIAKSETKKSVESTYLNADVITAIADLRTKINTITISDQRFGFAFFPSFEKLYVQSESAQSKQSLVGHSIDLRACLQSFGTEITQIEYSLEDMKKVIPDVEKPEGSINKFHMFLVKKEVVTDIDIYGLRSLNRLVSKIAHPEDEQEILSELKKEGLETFYKNDDWISLHRKILERYRHYLQKLRQALIEAISTNQK